MNGDYSDQKNKTKEGTQISLTDGLFYEIEYDATPMKGVGKYVLKSQTITPPVKDEIRELFHAMRDISRQTQSPNLNYAKFFDQRVRQDNGNGFYKQAVFMKDFEDDYPEEVAFSAYFPYYQMMSYEQLRTYFTWRTNVRKGVVLQTSLSYVFLYLYELLSNIGVNSPEEGLEQLLSFWRIYQQYDKTLDKYVMRWLKDYHIYYQLPNTFKEFVEANSFQKHYPKVIDHQNDFELYCSISKYDISKSVFYSEETGQLIQGCFNDVLDKVRDSFRTVGIHFEDILFSPSKKISMWKPFKDALFYQWYRQPNKRVVISDNEIYMCRSNVWTFSSVLTSDQGRQLVGYMMKQMESVLRKLTKYKFKLTAKVEMVGPDILSKLDQAGLSIEKIVENAVQEFYKETTKTVVKVDHVALHRIRQEALTTQEALKVEEHIHEVVYNGDSIVMNVSLASAIDSPSDINTALKQASEQNPAPNPVPNPAPNIVQTIEPSLTQEQSPVQDGWTIFKSTLTDREVQAFICILTGDSLKVFADSHNMMLEVLIDEINEKAMDHIGDNLIDDEQAIYEDYIDQVKEMVEV